MTGTPHRPPHLPTISLVGALVLHGVALAALLQPRPSSDVRQAQVMGFEVVNLTAVEAARTPAPEPPAETLPTAPVMPKSASEYPTRMPDTAEASSELLPEPLAASDPLAFEGLPPDEPVVEPPPVREAFLEQSADEPVTEPPPKDATSRVHTAEPVDPGPVIESAEAAPQTTPPRSDAAYLNNQKPSYPHSARRRRLEGIVLLEVEVSAKGLPLAVNIKASSGHGILDDAARNAVTRWRFRPAENDGRPVTATVDVPIRFALN